MFKNSSCVLIAFNPDAHEAGSQVEEIRREVKCTETTVGMNETYQAMGQGLRAEKRLLIPYDKDYNEERKLEYEGKRWDVLRVATGEENGVLLTIQRENINAGNPRPAAAEVGG